jgi:hypothetical protein
MKKAGFDAVPENLTAETLSRSDLDSTALITEPTLAAWGVRHRFLGDVDPAGAIAGCFEAAVTGSEPFVLLVTESMD